MWEIPKGHDCKSIYFGFPGPPLALVFIHKEAKACTSIKNKSFTINNLSDEQESPLHGNLQEDRLRLMGGMKDFTINKW
ncbi:hypothetical protein AS888_16500 [Peribacillus simplex]|uniref:Uncharacterized protein n=1 Tax=Peribacillus simplex TaxID=1478 RepID=A0A109N0G0_9BACI|nr:hypothetical protein [Peribacillus simplex]KWW21205.1 hypothetical protein AS888_16500 [Peribacillus simplex]